MQATEGTSAMGLGWWYYGDMMYYAFDYAHAFAGWAEVRCKRKQGRGGGTEKAISTRTTLGSIVESLGYRVGLCCIEGVYVVDEDLDR